MKTELQLKAMTGPELVVEHNALASHFEDVRPLNGWKAGKDKLVERIVALRKRGLDEMADRVSEDVEEDEPVADEPRVTEPEVGVKAPKSGRLIKDACYELLMRGEKDEQTKRLVGLPYETILEMVRDEFPGCETSVKSLRWYQRKLNESGARVPFRPRKRPVRAGKE